MRGDFTSSSVVYPIKLFQFAPLREGRLKKVKKAIDAKVNFNSRPCVRGDNTKISCIQSTDNFNSRPCVRDDKFPSPAVSTNPFQFTPLREGRLIAAITFVVNMLFQFTPLREGRLG